MTRPVGRATWVRALNVRCPRCGRPVGHECRRLRANTPDTMRPHAERVSAANAKRDEEGTP